MINPRISAVWSTNKPTASFSYTPRVQEVHTKAEVVHLTAGLLDLGVLFNCKVYDVSFGMYILYTWCTREWCNRFGRTPNCRDSRINHMFRNTFPMRDN